MAKASDKRISQSNDKALHNFRLGLLIVNAANPVLRFLFSFITSRPIRPRPFILLIHILSLAGTLAIYRWFKIISASRMDRQGIRAGEDLGGKGVVELAWDVVYVVWICTLGSAILGDWIWYLLLLIPGFGAWKAFSIVRPFLAMFLPGWFGPKQPKGEAEAVQAEEVPTESKRQAKLKARAEKGDKRVQQAQRRQ